MMDRTVDWMAAVDSACGALELGPDEAKRIKQSLMLKPKREHSQFAGVAEGVSESIRDLAEFIKANKRDYLSTGRLSEPDKDRVEEHVGLVVRTITQHLEALKNGVVAAQRPPDGGRPLINEQSAAHLHGTVLVLSEQLHGVTSGFDKCRAVRYQQTLARELRQHRKAPRVAALGGPQQQQEWQRSSDDGRGAAANGSMQQVQQHDTTQLLLEELRAASQQARGVERTVREITTINQMISTAVMQQAEQIEQLYNDAVESTQHVQRGNVELRKTIAVNRSSQRYMTVLIVTLALLLLFFDWFNS